MVDDDEASAVRAIPEAYEGHRRMGHPDVRAIEMVAIDQGFSIVD